MRETFNYISISQLASRRSSASESYEFPDLVDILESADGTPSEFGRLVSLHDATIVPKHYWVFKEGFALLEAMLDRDTFLAETINGPFHQYYNRASLAFKDGQIIANILPFYRHHVQKLSSSAVIFSTSTDDTNIFHFIYMTLPKLILVLNAHEN